MEACGLWKFRWGSVVYLKHKVWAEMPGERTAIRRGRTDERTAMTRWWYWWKDDRDKRTTVTKGRPWRTTPKRGGLNFPPTDLLTSELPLPPVHSFTHPDKRRSRWIKQVSLPSGSIRTYGLPIYRQLCKKYVSSVLMSCNDALLKHIVLSSEKLNV